MVEVNGFEPMTLCLQSRCSSQLSYTPENTSRYTRREKSSTRSGRENLSLDLHCALG